MKLWSRRSRNRNPRPAKRLHGGAQAARCRPINRNITNLAESTGIVKLLRERNLLVNGDRRWMQQREVRFRLRSPERKSSSVVSSGSILRRIKGAEPNASLLPRISNLGGVSAPWTLPNASESHFFNRFLDCLRRRQRIRGSASPHG